MIATQPSADRETLDVGDLPHVSLAMIKRGASLSAVFDADAHAVAVYIRTQERITQSLPRPRTLFEITQYHVAAN
jgi:hypothetical protein